MDTAGQQFKKLDFEAASRREVGIELTPPNMAELMFLEMIREYWQEMKTGDQIVIVKTPGGPVGSLRSV
jgi:hypothetical protein